MGRRFSPLDNKLCLRDDHWSEGIARVATRQGLQARSFEKAAEAVEEAVGRRISAESVRGVTQGFGDTVHAQREAEVERVADRPLQSELPPEALIAPKDPIGEQANVSTDGGMMLVRGEGWKEFKMTAISAVRALSPPERHSAQHARRHEPQVVLERHTYQAGLWNADVMEHYQYVEGLRRRITTAEPLTAVNDAAPWIKRITSTNFPNAEPIIDWHHAEKRLQHVGEAVFAGQPAKKADWVETQVDALWHGETHRVIAALDELDLAHPAYPDDVQQASGYFRNHHDRMDYPFYRDAGYPIGSGTVESGINTVVHHRMRRQGRGWNRDNAQAMLAALSVLHSDRFSDAWHRVHAKAA